VSQMERQDMEKGRGPKLTQALPVSSIHSLNCAQQMSAMNALPLEVTFSISLWGVDAVSL
jgi:hypothetical protein